MIRTKKSEWFKFDSPIGEPESKYYDDIYHIERLEKEDGEVVWFGINTNWVKSPGKNWTKLDCGEFEPCEAPIYEEMYLTQ